MSAPPAIAYPPEPTQAQEDYLVTSVHQWSLSNGLVVRSQSEPKDQNATTAPVTLYPSLFPRACFEEARAIQCAYNELYAKIASDEPWLGKIVDELLEIDDFIAKLWQVHMKVKQEGYVQYKPLSLGIFRSDYMVHQEDVDGHSRSQLRQIEFNTIASSFGGLSARVSKLHKYLARSCIYPLETGDINSDFNLPENQSTDRIASGLHLAHKAYGLPKSEKALPLCVLFIVQENETNIFDQVAISAALQTSHMIQVFRVTMIEVLTKTHIEQDNASRPLVYRPDGSLESTYEVSTVYLRAGYSPDEYSSQSVWEARYQLELSAAIKCPSILTHLAGSKKIQQILASPDTSWLEHYLSSTPYATYIIRVRDTFAAMYPLDDSPSGQNGINLAKDPQQCVKYVLKPQREGGGNNIYGTKIPPHLASLGNDEAKYRSHILMELIEPPSVHNTILRNGQMQSGEVIGELGIFGVILWRAADKVSPEEILENHEAGFLLRTKGRESEEGGVAAGFGAIDSPCLVD